MPVRAIAKTSIARNGVGAFVSPCHKITVQYCNWGGSSSGMREILKAGKLNEIASNKPHLFFEIVKRQGHPKLEFHYNNDTTKNIEVRNLSPSEIITKIQEFSQNSGNALSKFNQRVLSMNESVRGIWSPMHSPKEHRHKI